MANFTQSKPQLPSEVVKLLIYWKEQQIDTVTLCSTIGDLAFAREDELDEDHQWIRTYPTSFLLAWTSGEFEEAVGKNIKYCIDVVGRKWLGLRDPENEYSLFNLKEVDTAQEAYKFDRYYDAREVAQLISGGLVVKYDCTTNSTIL